MDGWPCKSISTWTLIESPLRLAQTSKNTRPKSRHAATISTTVRLWTMWCLNEIISLWPPVVSFSYLSQIEGAKFLFVWFLYRIRLWWLHYQGWSWIFVLLIIPCNFKSRFWQVSWDANDLKSPLSQTVVQHEQQSWAIRNTCLSCKTYSKWGMNLKSQVCLGEEYIQPKCSEIHVELNSLKI
jgi:hypothetical protein